MSIRYISGNIFEAKLDALINCVNVEGVMNKGLAKHFKEKFPEMFEEYAKACNEKKLVPGILQICRVQTEIPRFVINFPTKNLWRFGSTYEWIQAGVDKLFEKVIPELRITSIGIPALGCGLGGLKWEKVKPIIQTGYEKYGYAFKETEVVVFEPIGK